MTRGRVNLPSLCVVASFRLCVSHVPKGGLRPPRACPPCALNAARLPVPPLRRAAKARTPSESGQATRCLPGRGDLSSAAKGTYAREAPSSPAPAADFRGTESAGLARLPPSRDLGDGNRAHGYRSQEPQEWESLDQGGLRPRPERRALARGDSHHTNIATEPLEPPPGP